MALARLWFAIAGCPSGWQRLPAVVCGGGPTWPCRCSPAPAYWRHRRSVHLRWPQSDARLAVPSRASRQCRAGALSAGLQATPPPNRHSGFSHRDPSHRMPKQWHPQTHRAQAPGPAPSTKPKIRPDRRFGRSCHGRQVLTHGPLSRYALRLVQWICLEPLWPVPAQFQVPWRPPDFMDLRMRRNCIVASSSDCACSLRIFIC